MKYCSPTEAQEFRRNKHNNNIKHRGLVLVVLFIPNQNTNRNQHQNISIIRGLAEWPSGVTHHRHPSIHMDDIPPFTRTRSPLAIATLYLLSVEPRSQPSSPRFMIIYQTKWAHTDIFVIHNASSSQRRRTRIRARTYRPPLTHTIQHLINIILLGCGPAQLSSHSSTHRSSILGVSSSSVCIDLHAMETF